MSKKESQNNSKAIDLGQPVSGFRITIIPSITVKDGNPIMMMSPKDYEEYSRKVDKHEKPAQ